jgi:hypothetical protein
MLTASVDRPQCSYVIFRAPRKLLYLGSIVHHSLTSDADVDKRIRSASAAFGALQNILTNKDIDLKVKGSVYVALYLSILLYGSEI